MIRLQRRMEANLAWSAMCYLGACVIGFATTAILLKTSGSDVIGSLSSLFAGAFGSQKAIIGSLQNATPLILTGLATTVVYRAKIWSIGQEGQVFAGAMMAYWLSIYIPSGSPWTNLILLAVAGMTGGAMLGLLVGFFRNRFGISEIVSTVMLNYLIINLLAYLLDGGPWKEVGLTIAYHQSPKVNEDMQWLILFGLGKLHVGFLFAMAAAVLCTVVLERTPLGYEIRAAGSNPIALAFRGTDVGTMVITVMILSGALAGLAGAGELFGVSHRLRAESMAGLGYTGIIVAMVGGLRPSGVVIAAVFFGGLESGALLMKLQSGTPAALVPAMEGVLLLCFICAAVAARFRVVVRRAYA